MISLGVGFGLMNLTAIVIVSTYFKRRRALASSIASCGSGVGTLIMAPIISTLDNKFGWNYTMMMIGALMFACVPLGLLFRPIEYKEPEELSNKPDEKCTDDNNDDGSTHVWKRLITKFPTILSNAVFLTCILSNFLTNVGIAVPYVYTLVSNKRAMAL